MNEKLPMYIPVSNDKRIVVDKKWYNDDKVWKYTAFPQVKHFWWWQTENWYPGDYLVSGYAYWDLDTILEDAKRMKARYLEGLDR